MEKKKTLGVNPLAQYLASQANDVSESEQPAQPAHRTEIDIHKKERITIHLPIYLIDKIKNVVYWEPGLTLTAFAEYAFERAIKEQEEQRGEPYPERKERVLKSGRPVS